MPDGLVELEVQLRHPAQLQTIADVTAEESRGAFECFCRLAPRRVVAHGGVVDARHLQVR
jgi:hypothetical protein